MRGRFEKRTQLEDTSDCAPSTGGRAVYTDSGEALGSSSGIAVSLGDLDMTEGHSEAASGELPPRLW